MYFTEILMSTYADLELCIHCQSDGSYTADLRLQTPDNVVPSELATRQPVLFHFETLQQLSLDSAAYGRALVGMVFAEETMRLAWARARAYANGKGVPLRVRLNLGLSDALHALRWERMNDPEYQSPLALSEQVIFSRTLASPDLTPVVIPERLTLRALMVVANPTDLANYSLAPIAVAEEITRIKRALDPIPVTIIGDDPRAVQRRATLPAIIEQLRSLPDTGSTGPHIFYLLCHGTLVDGNEPYLWLEREDGNSEPTRAHDLVACIRDLSHRPLLAILASCQSAGQGYGDILSALGPQLSRAGIPAVLAMQGNVPMTTLTQVMPSFFRELQRDGQVDRALAAARGGLHRDPNWWVPVLFLHRRDGRLWSEDQAPAVVSPPRTIATDSGDYAEGTIDKRQGIFANELHIHSPLPTPNLPEPDIEQVLRAYLQWLQLELAETDVVPIANAYAVADTRTYVSLQVQSRHSTDPEPVFAALSGALTTQRPAGMLVIGDAGSGKSHTLRYAALAMAQAWPDIAPELQTDLGLAIDKPMLPVYVQLQDLPRCRAELRQAHPTTEPTVLDMVDHHLRRLVADANRWPAGWIRMLTAQHSCLFFFDGLDEIDDQRERNDLQRTLRRLLREHPEHGYLVTSRPQSDLGLGGTTGFVERHILPLQPPQMHRILVHWHRAEYGTERLIPEIERQVEQQSVDLLAKILQDPDFTPMAPNPLFLTAMARMALSTPGLPRLRVRKYDELVSLLLEWRRNRLRLPDQVGLFDQLSHRAALKRLADLALCMVHLGREELTPEAFLRGACRELFPDDGTAAESNIEEFEQLLRSVVRHTGLMTEQRGCYRFTFGFRDYLAGRGMTHFAHDLNDRLFHRRSELSWRTVIMLAVGYQASIEDPRRLKPLFVRLLADGAESTRLAAEMLCEAHADGSVPELEPERRQVLARLRDMGSDPDLIRRLERLDTMV